MNKKKIFLICITVITVLSIVIGTIYHFHNFKTYVFSLDEEYCEGDTEGRTLNYSSINQEFSSIEIDGHVMEVKIKGGNYFDYDISYSHEKLMPEVKIENDTLIIKQRKFKNLAGSRNKCFIDITVPYNIDFNEIDIESNVGELKVKDVRADKISLTTNVGEISASEVTFDSFKAVTNVGELSLDTFGDIEDFNIEASTNVGEVKVNSNGYKRSYNQKGKTDKEVLLETNVGEITIR